MRLTRTFVVTVVIVVLLAMAAPAAQARAIEKPQSVLHAQGGAWLDLALDNAMTWLTRLARSAPLAPAAAQKATTTNTNNGTGNGTGSTIGPLTGVCIDPLGRGLCI